MNELTIQVDTFCATQCSFCQLGDSNRVHKKITYNSHDFLAFADAHNTRTVTITGGDTFLNREVFYTAFNNAISINGLETIIIPFELIKIKRDREVIEYILKNKGNISIALSISINPYIDNTKYINILLDMRINFNSHIVVGKHDMSDKGSKALSDTIILLKSHGITTEYHMDFTTVKYAPDKESLYFFNKIREDYREIIGNYQFDSVQTYNRFSLEFGCKAITGKGIGISTDGSIADCVGISPEKGLGSKNYNVSEYLKYHEIMDSKGKTNLHNENEYCNRCEIKNVCQRCPKTINNTVQFTGNSLLCAINKSLYKNSIKILKEEKQ